jgi:hypothetical protein
LHFPMWCDTQSHAHACVSDMCCHAHNIESTGWYKMVNTMTVLSFPTLVKEYFVKFEQRNNRW